MRQNKLKDIALRPLLAVSVTAMVLFSAIVASDVPQLLSYQGRLTDELGVPLDTSIAMTFVIYDAPSEGNAVWSETHSSVRIYDGLFNVLLGSGSSPLPDSVFIGTELYLGVWTGCRQSI
jgi:hypothetical protein